MCKTVVRSALPFFFFFFLVFFVCLFVCLAWHTCHCNACFATFARPSRAIRVRRFLIYPIFFFFFILVARECRLEVGGAEFAPLSCSLDCKGAIANNSKIARDYRSKNSAKGITT